mgnify:FL=1
MSKTFRQSRRDRDYFDSSEYSDQEYNSKKQARKKEHRKQKYYDDFEDTSRYEFKPQKIRY